MVKEKIFEIVLSSLIAAGSTCITLYYRLVHIIIVLGTDLIELSPALDLDELARGDKQGDEDGEAEEGHYAADDSKLVNLAFVFRKCQLLESKTVT